MPSPKARPPQLRMLTGRSPGRDSGGRVVKPGPAFRRLPPEAPDWLPDEARAEWERVVPELARLQLLKPVDGAALVAYCLAWDRLVTATRSSRSEPPVVDGKRNPLVVTAEHASKELRAWCGEFGCTPSAEGRLNVPSGDDDGGDDNPFSGASS